MYTEEYEQKGFPIKDFILKAVLVLIFVFLLVWLLPKFIAPIINKNTDSVKADVLATEIVTGQTDGYTKEWNINGEKVTLGVEKED